MLYEELEIDSLYRSIYKDIGFMYKRMLMGTATYSRIAALLCFVPEAVLQYSGSERTIHFFHGAAQIFRGYAGRYI